MGLSDIDEDEPVTHSPSRPIVLVPPSAVPAVVISTTATNVKSTNPVTAASLNVANDGTNSNSNNGNKSASPSGSLSGGSVLDDLFGSMDVNASPNSTRGAASLASMSSSAAAKPASTTSATAAVPSVLDDLFAASAPNPATAASDDKQSGAAAGAEAHAVLYVDGSGPGAEDDGTNLLDLSKPVKKDRYNSAESFLDAFERQGKKGADMRADQRETLANLTRNKDDNKVRARLLALMNYYDVLGVAQTASEEEIKRSYKKKALELHPDRVGRGQTQEEAELFKVITKAHEVLTDPAQRRIYDASLAEGQQQPATAASANDWWNHVNM